MSSLNKIILVGTLENAPEVRVTNAGDAFAKFILNVSRPTRTDGAPAGQDAIDIVAWRQVADQAAQLTQNATVLIEGRIVTRATEEDGKKKYFTEVEAREINPMTGGAAVAATSTEKPKKTTVQKKQVEEIQESDFDFGKAAEKVAVELDEEVPF